MLSLRAVFAARRSLANFVFGSVMFPTDETKRPDCTGFTGPFLYPDNPDLGAPCGLTGRSSFDGYSIAGARVTASAPKLSPKGMSRKLSSTAKTQPLSRPLGLLDRRTLDPFGGQGADHVSETILPC